MNIRTASILSGLALVGLASTAFVQPAQAGFFDGIQNTINQVNGTVDSAKGIHSSTNSTLGNLGDLGRTLGLSPSAPSTDLFDVYQSWYGSMSPSEKEVVKALVTEYAEDKELNFSGFKKSPEYSRLSTPAKSSASAIFFKFKEVSNAAKPVKDKFLAFAFCLSGGSTKCK